MGGRHDREGKAETLVRRGGAFHLPGISGRISVIFRGDWNRMHTFYQQKADKQMALEFT